jgi:gas vesicle protein
MRIGKYEASDRSTLGTAIAFLFIGMGVGAITALLLTPKSGPQVRRALRRKYEDAREAVGEWKDEAQERAEEVQDRIDQTLDRGADWAKELGETARAKLEPLGKAIKRG